MNKCTMKSLLFNPLFLFTGLLILSILLTTTYATVVPRRAVLGFSSNVQRNSNNNNKRSSTTSSTLGSGDGGSSTNRYAGHCSPSSSSSSTEISAATINVREVLEGSFFSSETIEQNYVEDNHPEKNGNTASGSKSSRDGVEKSISQNIFNRWSIVHSSPATSSSSHLSFGINDQIISIKTFANSPPPAILLTALITTLVISRRGVWLRSLKSTLRLLSSLSTWYLNRLEKSPLLTKCITGGIIAWIGDYGAQWLEQKLIEMRRKSEDSSLVLPSIPLLETGRENTADTAVNPSFLFHEGASDNAYLHYHRKSQQQSSKHHRREIPRLELKLHRHEQNSLQRHYPPQQQKHHQQHHDDHHQKFVAATTAISNTKINNNNNNKYKISYDYRRGLARFLECLLISSPLMHYGYELFEYILPVVARGNGGIYQSLAALSHVIADSVFLDGIFVATGIIATGLFEGHSLRRHVLPNLRNVYLPTMKASVCTSSALIPLQFLSFRFLPVQLRVLSVNAVDLIWTGVVSFVSHSSGVCEGEMER